MDPTVQRTEMSIETLLEAAKFLELQAQQQQKTRGKKMKDHGTVGTPTFTSDREGLAQTNQWCSVMSCLVHLYKDICFIGCHSLRNIRWYEVLYTLRQG